MIVGPVHNSEIRSAAGGRVARFTKRALRGDSDTFADQSGSRKVVRIERVALAFVLLAALLLRLHNIGFGLPSMYDPDEPIFMITALKMLTQQTLNPGWFGHPGSTTIYLVALSDALVVGFGRLSGNYGSLAEFTKAAYADPGLLFIPARVAMALLGVASIWLTYVVGRRLHGTATGLIAAALLAVNALHIAWSQVIRTDIHASVFMLVVLFLSIRIVENGKWKDYILAGIVTGFAIATKWPAASIVAAIVGAFAYRCRMQSNWRQESGKLAIAGIATLVGLFLASPFIFLDWQTVLANVAGEARPIHLGHTGGGFASNLASYLRYQVAGSMGWVGLLFVLAGVIVSGVRAPAARWTVIPATAAFLILICAQNLIWSRWLLPAMPMFCIFAGVAVVALSNMLARRVGSRAARPILIGAVGLVAIPSVLGAYDQSVERSNDTREQVARWAIANIPPGSTIVLEHLALKLRHHQWTILFPIGDAGCIDGVKLLSTGVRYEDVQRLRNGSPIVDLGHVPPHRRPSCRADFAILTYYDLYKTEAAMFPDQVANYEALLAGGRTVALFRPYPGRADGPIVRVVALQHNR